MNQLQKIEIDWDIHKLIEAERTSFNEPPYVALRRLLKLPAPQSDAAVVPQDLGNGIPWTDAGVVVPHGALARMEYDRGRQIYEGRFLNGKLIVDGQQFESLSAAANALAVTKDGNKTSLNGWNYWKVKFPGETTWRPLNALRKDPKV